MKTLKITQAEWTELVIALERRGEDFMNYTKKDMEEFPEIAEITETLADLTLKVLALNPKTEHLTK